MTIEATPILSIYELAAIYCNVHELTILAMQAPNRKSSIMMYRMVFCHLALDVYGHRLCDLSRLMRRNHSTILKRVSKYHDLMDGRHPYEPLQIIYLKTKPALP